MADKNYDKNPENYPALGRWMMWVEKPGSLKKIIRALIAVCVLCILLNFTYSGKGHYSAESIPGFYALYGFVAFTFIIFVAKFLRTIIMRPEDYYGKKAIDTEEWPEAELERKDHVDD